MKKAKKAKTKQELLKRLSNLGDGRDEMNLCELPFATLSERNTGRTMMQFQVEDFDPEYGAVVERTLTVKGDPEFGLPTQKDEEIYLGLLKYSSDYNGFAEPEVHFRRSDLFELMGWPKSDWAYGRLTKAMHRLTGVRLSYQNLWRDNGCKQWRDQGAFAILDSFEFRDRRAAGANSSFQELNSKFRWGSVLFESFDSGYLKRIDYGLTRDLNATTRRLYRYLDKHFHPPRKTVITIDLARLAYQHIGISPGVALDKVRKRHIEPAIDALISRGYLKPRNEAFEKLRRGIWNVSFEMAAITDRSQQESKSQKLAKALEKRGVATKAVALILAKYGEKAVVQAMKAMDEQIKKGVEIRSPSRWLEVAIEQGFQVSPSTRRSAARPELRIFRPPKA